MKITFRDKNWEMKSGMTARDAIKKIGVDPESVKNVMITAINLSDPNRRAGRPARRFEQKQNGLRHACPPRASH